jgi:hypothetical protein
MSAARVADLMESSLPRTRWKWVVGATAYENRTGRVGGRKVSVAPARWHSRKHLLRGEPSGAD